jgi:hypothetical protein
MSETPVINPNEQYVQPGQPLAAEAVFDGVYQSFAYHAKQLPLERNMFIDGEVKRVAVDPVADFVRARFTEAEKTIEPLAGQPVRPADVSDKFIDEATIEAKAVYDGNPLGISARVESSKRVVSGFIDRATDMVRNVETDGLTVKLFFDRIQGFKYGLSANYNDLVTKTDEPLPDKEGQDRYANAVHRLFTGKEDVQEQDSGPFLHVNGKRYSASGTQTTERYYISTKLNGQPEEAVRIWTETLAEMGLDEKLYYKVAEGMSHRFETVVAYATPETADEMEAAIQEFARRCPPELMSDTVLPTGVEVAKGVAKAPEPNELNTLLRYRGKDTISYNQFACALTELALRRASYDFMKQGIKPEAVTPRALSQAAKPYFVQFTALSGIDPATMRVAA